MKWIELHKEQPKDGQQVIAGYFDTRWGEDEHFEYFMDVFSKEVWEDKQKNRYESYSHWMPLPKPPKTNKELK